MLEVRESSSCCFPREVVGVNVALALLDGIIAVLAFSQLIRIHSRNSQLGWTRQKVFHLLIGSSNVGYFVFFILTAIASCKGWLCWSYSCGFILMALPKIPSFAAFLLLLSFWVDLCHQAHENDYEEEEFSFHDALLEMRLHDPSSTHADGHRFCLPFRSIQVGSRQKLVILITLLVFLLMITFTVLMWIGMGHTTVDFSSLAKVFADLCAAGMLLLGVALTYYGLLLCMKMRRVRSERAASEMWKVLYYCQLLQQNAPFTSLLLIVYYFIGSSLPSSFLLWIMRELPTPGATSAHGESRTITFVTDSSATVQHHHRWTTATSLQNEISRGSPI